MQYAKNIVRALLFTLTVLAPLLSIYVPDGISSGPSLFGYSLNPVPAVAQEGTTITLVLTVKGVSSGSGTMFQFRFFVRDPSGTTFQSVPQNYTTVPNQDQFSVLVNYPSVSFPGSNSLIGQYSTWVDQLLPFALAQVATNSFVLSITDNSSYERTQTVNMRASGYNASESVTITIRTQTTSTLVFSQTVPATAAGIVSSSWKIPTNATIDNYVLTLMGTSTFKSPADTERFSVRPASMSILVITASKSTYQRTETMKFSFQPKYPDGNIASTGVALLTLARPDGTNITLPATYDTVTQTFSMSYKTAVSNETGTWTATLSGHAYSDAYGNTGPGEILSSSPQLAPANLSVTVVTNNTSFGVGQPIRFNATIVYPDGTAFQSGGVGAYLLFSGVQQTVNDTVALVYDTGLMLWVGTYTPKATDNGGLWSLVVKASDASYPSNSGSATRAITIQNNTSAPPGDVSLPLYYFGLVAALIAGLLTVGFLAFRRRKVSHARLKIDLEAVRSEAGKIENQEFFQSVKDQLKKNKDE